MMHTTQLHTVDTACLVYLPCHLIKRKSLPAICCLQGSSQMRGNVKDFLNGSVELDF